MMSLPPEEVYNKLVACGRMAERLGAKVLGLGAYAAVIGDAGKTVADRLDIAVTTGDSYTVEMAVEAVREAARQMEINVAEATVAVVGATGAIGKTCAQMLAEDCAHLRVIGRREQPTQHIRELCEGRRAQVTGSTDISTIYDADLILTVTNAVSSIIEPQHLKPGAVICDVARPRDVSRRVFEQRDDVLVIEGGMVEVPGPVDFNFDFGFPPKMAYACMAETMALAMDGRYEDYTIGKNIPLLRRKRLPPSPHGTASGWVDSAVLRRRLARKPSLACGHAPRSAANPGRRLSANLQKTHQRPVGIYQPARRRW